MQNSSLDTHQAVPVDESCTQYQVYSSSGIFKINSGYLAEHKWFLRIKRVLDIVISVILIVLTLPLLLIAVAGILISSKGPVFYLGKRGGKNCSQFTCFKLRTMHVDQDAILKAQGLINIGDSGRLLVFRNDPRIGRFGAFLRKASIDELPQLINVVRGDMSLIGPRALVLSMLEEFPEIASARSIVRPGISGLWQVRSREKNVSVLDMVDDDMEYIQGLRFALDVKIALLTLPKIIEPKPKRGRST